MANIEQHEGGLAHFAEGYKTMGLQVDDQGGVRYREWAPGATEARLIGEFSELLASEHCRRWLTSRQLVPYREPDDQVTLWCLGVLRTS